MGGLWALLEVGGVKKPTKIDCMGKFENHKGMPYRKKHDDAKKKMLIFAHYYVPDAASTGQILKDLAEGMLDEFDVTVICVVPSYNGTIDDKYITKKYYFEELNYVKLIRVRVPEFTKTNKFSRVKNILAYFFGALGASLKAGKQDFVFTISQPPILGGVLGVLGKWQKHAKMIYCIQDFNPEQIMAVGYYNNKFLLSIAMTADKFSCRMSNLIVTVGQDLAETLRNRFKSKNVPHYIVINNWIDEKKIYPLENNDENVAAFKRKYGLVDAFVIMYSGNIGLYYDLENIIKVIGQFRNARTRTGKKVVFAFVGDGSMRNKLIEYVEKHDLENVIFIPYQNREKLIYSLNAGDVHWCVNSKGIKGVSCPSKVYGIMAAGKPILGVLEKGTEARILIEKCDCGRCCEPSQYEEIGKLIKWNIDNDSDVDNKLSDMGIRGRKYLEENLTKNAAIKRYVMAISALEG